MTDFEFQTVFISAFLPFARLMYNKQYFNMLYLHVDMFTEKKKLYKIATYLTANLLRCDNLYDDNRIQTTSLCY